MRGNIRRSSTEQVLRLGDYTWRNGGGDEYLQLFTCCPGVWEHLWAPMECLLKLCFGQSNGWEEENMQRKYRVIHWRQVQEEKGVFSKWLVAELGWKIVLGGEEEEVKV